MGGWTGKVVMHSLRHNMVDGLFVRNPCVYSGLNTVDFRPEWGGFCLPAVRYTETLAGSRNLSRHRVCSSGL